MLSVLALLDVFLVFGFIFDSYSLCHNPLPWTVPSCYVKNELRGTKLNSKKHCVLLNGFNTGLDNSSLKLFSYLNQIMWKKKVPSF